MKEFLGFKLSDEQFEELAKIVELDELGKFILPTDYIHTPEANTKAYNNKKYINREVIIKIFDFLHRNLGVSQEEFKDHFFEWYRDYLNRLSYGETIREIVKIACNKNSPKESKISISQTTITLTEILEEIAEHNKIKYEEEDEDVIYIENSNQLTEYIKNVIMYEIICILKEALETYQEAGTDEHLTLAQKKEGLNNTIKIIQSSLEPIQDNPIKEKALNFLLTLETKINSISHDGRARQLEELINRITEAKANYILKDEKTGKIFYPIVADMLYFELKTIEYIEKHKPIIKPLASNIHAIKKNKEILNELNNDMLKRAIFYEARSPTLKKKRHYLASLFSKELKIGYGQIKKLIEHLFYQVANNAKLPKTPFKELPEPIIHPLKYSQEILLIA